MLFSPKTLLLLFAVSWLPNWNTITRSGEIRQYKQQASEAFKAEDYETALVFYRHLYDKMNITEEEILVNLAHCYFIKENTKQATALYQIASRSKKVSVQSLAWQQLGVLAYRQRRYGWAATCFKNALQSNSLNEDARYNYELAQKMLALNAKKTVPPPSSPPPPPPPSPDNDTTRNTQRSLDADNPYTHVGLSKEQAEILLNAIKASEKQYIQQQKKGNHKKTDPSLPDW